MTDEQTFGGYVDRYWGVLATRLSPARAVVELAYLNKHLRPHFGAHRLDRLNMALVRDFAASMRVDGYAPGTINTALSILRKILGDAVEREIIQSLPLRGKLPRERETLLRAEMSDEERIRFLAAFDDEAAFASRLVAKRVASLSHKGIRPGSLAAHLSFQRFHDLRPVFVLALETGLSRSDLLGLTWDTMDGGVIRTARRKTGVEATIPLSNEACAAIGALWSRRRSGLPLLPQVCIDADGTPYPLGTILRAFAVAKGIAGLRRRFRFHDMRHTFASRLASRGVSLQVIARALGHASTRMSERYARPDEGAMLEVRCALSAAPAPNQHSMWRSQGLAG